MSTITDEQIAKLKADNPGWGELHKLGNKYAEALFRLPNEEEYQRFIDELADSDTKGVAMRNLVRTCVVVPDEAGFRALLKSRPGLVQSFGNELIDIAGLAKVTERKKY